MNPLTIWTSMKSSTKMTIVITVGLIIISSMFTGYFDEILNLFK